MNRFDYVRPGSVAGAIAAAAAPGATYIAAGTNLLDLMKAGIARPERLVDITRLPGLDRIERLPDGSLRIGALVRNADLAHDMDFAQSYPAVAEALLSGASAQLRNMATVGGNILQRSRHVFHAAIGDGPPVGETRTNAILGWNDTCSMVHPSDFCVPLVALDAVVEIEGRAGRREVALEVFYHLAEGAREVVTALEPGDLVTAVRLPAGAAEFLGHARYLKLRERTSYAFALVSAAAAVDMKDGKIVDARIALGGVAPKPWRARAAEEVLKGTVPGREIFHEAAKVALAGARASGDNLFKIELAKRIVVRALAAAADGSLARLPALPASLFSTNPGATQNDA